MRVAEQIWDGDSEAQWQTPEDWIRNAAALIRQAGSGETTKLRADYDREHKWLNDAASEANSDLDSVASVIRKLRQAGSERERELRACLGQMVERGIILNLTENMWQCLYCYALGKRAGSIQHKETCDWAEASRLLGGEL